LPLTRPLRRSAMVARRAARGQRADETLARTRFRESNAVELL
jgi:hypothetical protein